MCQVSVGLNDNESEDAMTRQEFAARSKTAERREKRFNAIWGTVFFGILIGNWLYLQFVDPEWPDSYWIAYMIIFFGFLVGNIPFTVRAVSKIRRESGLECSLCQEVLDKDATALAITTGNCVHCAQAFLSD
mgnify:CR=1 FL=1